MGNIVLMASSIAVLAACAVPAAAAGFAYVSVSGEDTNACTITSPCRGLFRAVQAIGSEGIITMLDDGDYVGTTLSGNLTIQGQGPGTVISNPGATAIKVNSGHIVLRNFSIDAFVSSPGQIGIDFTGTSLNVENVTIRNQFAQSFTSWGIILLSTNAIVRLKNVHISYSGQGDAVGGGIWMRVGNGDIDKVTIDNCSFDYNSRGIFVDGFGNGTVQLSINNTTVSNSRSYGMFVNPAAGTIKLNINDSEFVSNAAAGLYIAPTGGVVSAKIARSEFDNNAIGIRADAINNSKVRASLADVSASNNSIGIYASRNAAIDAIRTTVANNTSAGISMTSPALTRIGSSVVTGNGVGLAGPISSYGNNQLLGNTSQGSASPVAPGSAP